MSRSGDATNGWRTPRGVGDAVMRPPVTGSAVEAFVAGEPGGLARVALTTGIRSMVLVPGLWLSGKVFSMPLTGGKLTVTAILGALMLTVVEVLYILGRNHFGAWWQERLQ